MHELDSLLRFYSGFAGKYDLFVSWDKRINRERRFFKYLLDSNGVETVLDCFCGTGFHVSMLSEMGYTVDGIDISPDMVDRAKRNLEGKMFDADVRVCDVKSLDADNNYDCVLSMGNSLPHEFGDGNVSRALKNMYRALKHGGICVIHMENFDLLYEDGDRFIPSAYSRTGDGAEVFIFAIDYHEKKVTFNVISVIERDGRPPQFDVDVVEYNPIGVGRIKALLSGAGFNGLELYEDFLMTPLGKNRTYDLMVVAKKL